MNSVFVYCEIEEGMVADVSLELLTKGRTLANELGVKLEAVALGSDLKDVDKQVFPFGVDVLWIGDDKRLYPYTTLPHTSILVNLFKEEKPQIAFMGASSIGRDLGPRVSSALHSGLTADCTSLEIGDYEDKKNNKIYNNLLYQIRPVREGVMKKEVFDPHHTGEIKKIDVNKYVNTTDFVVKVIERHMEKSKVNLKAAPIIVAGGYGVGSKENFALLQELANVLGGEVGASRAAVDAGFCEHERQIGQTGTTVRPKMYIACGISGQIQHTAGMEESAMVIAINTDSNAPINKFADYVITGDLNVIIPKMIKYYKKNSK